MKQKLLLGTVANETANATETAMDETETAISTVANETANATETAMDETETAIRYLLQMKRLMLLKQQVIRPAIQFWMR